MYPNIVSLWNIALHNVSIHVYIYAHTIAGQPSDFLNLQQTCTGKSVYHDDTCTCIQYKIKGHFWDSTTDKNWTINILLGTFFSTIEIMHVTTQQK